MAIQTSVLKALSSGRRFSAKQLAGMYKTTEGSIRARISELRSVGIQIVTGTSKTGTTVYSLDRASSKA